MASSDGAIIAAGGRCRADLLEATGQPHRALVPVAGRPVLEYVLDAVRDAQRVSHAVVLGPAECRGIVESAGPKFSWMPPGETLLDNLLAGAQVLGDHEQLLACAADAPLITGASLDRLLEVASERHHAFLYPIIERSVCERAYPGTRRTYARLTDGVFTGGNAMVISRSLLVEHRDRIRAAYDSRKSPLQLAKLLGWGIAFRLLLGRASIAEAESRASEIVGVPVSAVISEDAALGIDIDKVADLRLVESVLAARSRPSQCGGG